MRDPAKFFFYLWRGGREGSWGLVRMRRRRRREWGGGRRAREREVFVFEDEELGFLFLPLPVGQWALLGWAKLQAGPMR